MRFILNMAYREMRSSWPRLLLFFLCIAIGVGSIIGVRSLLQNLNVAVNRETRTLFMGDVQVASDRPWNPDTRAVLERYSGSPVVSEYASLVETMSMALPLDDPNAPPIQVQLKAVTDRFPLYGELLLSDGSRYTPALLANRGVLVQPSLLTKLNAKVGDELMIGRLTFVIRG